MAGADLLDMTRIVATQGASNRKSSVANSDDFRAHIRVFNDKPSHSDRQLEPFWPGTAGIEVEHAVPNFVLGDVAVA